MFRPPPRHYQTVQQTKRWYATCINLTYSEIKRERHVQEVQVLDTLKSLYSLLTFTCPCITNIIPNYNQQDATFLDLFISTDALQVSGDSSAHHQEHITVHTASGIVNQYCCWRRWNAVPSPPWQQPATVLVDNTWSCMYSYVLLMMGGGTAWNM